MDLAAEPANTLANSGSQALASGHLEGLLQAHRDRLLTARELARRLAVPYDASLERLRTQGNRGAGAAAAGLEAIRAVGHSDALPRVVSRASVGPIEQEMNAPNAEFAAGFSAHGGEGLAFVADFHDGRSQPATHLCGGWMVRPSSSASRWTRLAEFCGRGPTRNGPRRRRLARPRCNAGRAPAAGSAPTRVYLALPSPGMPRLEAYSGHSPADRQPDLRTISSLTASFMSNSECSGAAILGSPKVLNGDWEAQRVLVAHAVKHPSAAPSSRRG